MHANAVGSIHTCDLLGMNYSLNNELLIQGGGRSQDSDFQKWLDVSTASFLI